MIGSQIQQGNVGAKQTGTFSAGDRKKIKSFMRTLARRPSTSRWTRKTREKALTPVQRIGHVSARQLARTDNTSLATTLVTIMRAVLTRPGNVPHPSINVPKGYGASQRSMYASAMCRSQIQVRRP
jgi:hypothetical protein